MNMSIDSVIAHTINNILVGDMYLEVRNVETQEKIEIYPTRLEKCYKHQIDTKYLHDCCDLDDDIADEMYMDEVISCETIVYGRFRINGKFTHAMQLRSLSSFISLQDKKHTPSTETTPASYRNVEPALYFMPYNVEVLKNCGAAGSKFHFALWKFIEHTFPDLPTTCVHDFEQMKLSKETMAGHKRKRDKVMRM